MYVDIFVLPPGVKAPFWVGSRMENLNKIIAKLFFLANLF